MLTRSLHTSTIGRAASVRRLRRRQVGATRLYCATNGCTSFLEPEPNATEAVCPVCGYRRRLS